MVYDEKTLPPLLWDECQRLVNKMMHATDAAEALDALVYAQGVIRGFEILRAIRPNAVSALSEMLNEAYSRQQANQPAASAAEWG